MTGQLLAETWRIHFKGDDAGSFVRSILNNMEYRLAKDRYSATEYDQFLSAAYSVMEHLVERWIATQQTYHKQRPKRLYYLSMEYLLGRSLENALINMELLEPCQQALSQLGLNLADITEQEADAGLGNGGLGRLAACFLDSLATLGYAAHGYGIRYDYGLFHQRIVNGQQVEVPDNWLHLPSPWEIARPEFIFGVRFGGYVERMEKDGRQSSSWVDGDEVHAMAYDLPIPGYSTPTVNTLRLWSAQAPEEFNLAYFNHGDYMQASEEQVTSENITKVLYPNDNFFVGKELRLRQEYFLVSASVQDIVRRFKSDALPWLSFPDQVAIQLNDTHPALAIPELMRILIDEEDLEWEAAWDITVRTFGYTNHTVLPEALEEWPVSMLENLLPRHLEIMYLINHHFLKDVACRYPGDVDRLRRMSIIGEEGVKRVRMANLAVVGSHAVNGVAALHTRLLRETILRDFAEYWPEKFSNKTNGITPRRWLRKANAPLAGLITEAIGDGWLTDLSQLRRLEPFTDDASFRLRWWDVQQTCKKGLIDLIHRENAVTLHPEMLFDVQVKRMHEYKRQLLFALYAVAAYLRIKEGRAGNVAPRVCIFGGKAAPGYERAKLIIRLICRIADVINQDPAVDDLLRVVFLPNYRVSLAEQLIPAADLSEQISTAGKEASGTGNMKFTLNGAVTIGTLDGANVEILEEVGPENIFIFGHNADEISALKCNGYDPRAIVAATPELQQVLHLLECDFFSPSETGLFRPIYDELLNHDEYCLLADFADYLAAQERAGAAYLDEERWARMSILNTARSGKFSSDRTILEYARDIWGITPVEVPIPEKIGPGGLTMPI
ncbi:MAG: glycogen/starch/alpha-glucan phosphorylase [Armatimonadota bacterium]